MKEYAVVWSHDSQHYPFTDYVFEIDLKGFLEDIENSDQKHLIECYEI